MYQLYPAVVLPAIILLACKFNLPNLFDQVITSIMTEMEEILSFSDIALTFTPELLALPQIRPFIKRFYIKNINLNFGYKNIYNIDSIKKYCHLIHNIDSLLDFNFELVSFIIKNEKLKIEPYLIKNYLNNLSLPLPYL